MWECSGIQTLRSILPFACVGWCCLNLFNVYIYKNSWIKKDVFTLRVEYRQTWQKLNNLSDCFPFQIHSPVNNSIDMSTPKLNKCSGIRFRGIYLFSKIWIIIQNTKSQLTFPVLRSSSRHSIHTYSILWTPFAWVGYNSLIYFRERFFIKGRVD